MAVSENGIVGEANPDILRTDCLLFDGLFAGIILLHLHSNREQSVVSTLQMRPRR